MTMPEDALTSDYIGKWDQEFQLGTVEGISFVSASGDGGAYNDMNNPAVPCVGFPASDPYVTSVGGTQVGIDSSNNAIDSQTGWSPNGSWNGLPAASGGGYSSFFSVPNYQSSVSRGLPDLSFMATYPYYLIYDSNYYGFGPPWVEQVAVHRPGPDTWRIWQRSLAYG